MATLAALYTKHLGIYEQPLLTSVKWNGTYIVPAESYVKYQGVYISNIPPLSAKAFDTGFDGGFS